MFEGIAASVLNKILGDYVTNLETNQLNVGVWQGDVQLHKLRLKKEALDRFKLPIDVLEGYLGTLTLSIPWSNIKSQPIKINIEDVYLLASPRFDTEYNSEEEQARELARKLKKLEDLELLMHRPKVNLEDDKKQTTFTEQLITKVIDNLQVKIKNIHIRYEDSVSNLGTRFSVGVTLNELSAVSTNQDWEPTFIHEPNSTIHKLLKLRSLSAYWDTNSGSLSGLPADEFIQRFCESIKSKAHESILIPIEGTGKIILHKKPEKGEPKRKASFEFDQLAFELSDEQYKDILLLMTQFDYTMRQKRYHKYRPRHRIRPKDDPQAWLMFAFKSVYKEIHDRNQRWTWEYIREFGKDRRDYIRCYTKLNVEGGLTNEETQLLKDLEVKHSYEALRLFRSLAQREIRKGRAILRKKQEAENTKKLEDQRRAKGSWLGGWMTGWSTPVPQEKPEDSTDTILTEEHMQELFDTIDYDEDAIVDYDTAPDMLLLNAKVKLNTASVKLKVNRDGRKHVLLAMILDHCHLTLVKRIKNICVDMSVHQFRVIDGTVKNPIYPTIIYVHNPNTESISGSESDLRFEGIPDAEGGLAAAVVPDVREQFEESEDEYIYNEFASKTHFGNTASHQPFMNIHFEKYPLDGHADSLLKVQAQSLNVVYHPRAIRATIDFFEPPSSTAESINALIAAASKSVRGLRNQTRAGLEYALEKHKTLDLQVDFDAPVVVVPQDVTDPNSSVVVLDMGNLNMVSNLADKAEINRVRNRDGQDLTEEQMTELEELMYDQFTINIHSTQLLVGHDIPSCMDVIRSGRTDSHFHVIDRIELDFKLGLCIMKNPPVHMPKFKIDGRLPSLQLYFSDVKYKAIMHTIDLIMEGIDGEDSKLGKQEKQALRLQELEKLREATPSQRLAYSGLIVGTAQTMRTFPYTAFGGGGLFGRDGDDGNDFKDTLDIDSVSNSSEDSFESTDGDIPELEFKDAEDTLPSKRNSGVSAGGSSTSKTKDPEKPALDPTRKVATVKFSVDTLIGVIHRSRSSSQKDLHIADIMVHGLTVDVVNRPFDLWVDVVIHQITLEDCLFQHTSDIKESKVYALTSDVDEAGISGDLDKNLVTVHYYRTQEDHPDFDPTKGSVGQRVDVDVSFIDIMAIRRSILTYYDFILRTFTDGPKSNGDNASLSKGSSEPSSPHAERMDTKVDDSDFMPEKNNIVDKSNDPVAMLNYEAMETIKVFVNLHGIGLGLNMDDGSPIASMSVADGRAEITVSDKVKVEAKIGSLTVLDQLGLPKLHRPPRTIHPEKTADSYDSSSRLLLYIKGDELADLLYQGYDQDAEDYPGYDSLFQLQVGAAHVTFVEKQYKELMFFFSQFAAMHNLFEKARQAAAQQAVQLSETVIQGSGRTKIDITMMAPVITFPELGKMPYDCPSYSPNDPLMKNNVIIGRLGEMTLTNSFQQEKSDQGLLDINKFSLDLKHIGMTSHFKFEDISDTGTFGQPIIQELNILEDVSYQMEMLFLAQERPQDCLRPNTEINSTLEPIKMRLTEEQYIFIYDIIQVIGRTFGADSNADKNDPLSDNADLDLAIFYSPKNKNEKKISPSLSKSPAKLLKTESSNKDKSLDDEIVTYTNLDFVLNQSLIELEVIQGIGVIPDDIATASLTKIMLKNLKFKYKSLSNGESKAEFQIGAAHAYDTRHLTTNKFTHLISPVTHRSGLANDQPGSSQEIVPQGSYESSPQFICHIEFYPSEPPILTATLDAPKIYLVIDHIFAIWQFIMKPFGGDEKMDSESDHGERNQSPVQSDSENTDDGLMYKFNIVDSEIILLAESTSSSSEALVVTVKEIVMAQRGLFCITADHVSINIYTIGNVYETNRSIVDPFRVEATIANSNSLGEHGEGNNTEIPTTDIAILISTLTLRLGYRDIGLIMQVRDEITKLLGDSPDSSNSAAQSKADFTLSPSPYECAPGIRQENTNQSQNSMAHVVPLPSIHQKMRISLDSIRLVLIRELFDMPMYDIFLKRFHVNVKDWSSLLHVHSDVDIKASFFNRRNSHWEPLAESWPFSINLSSTMQPTGDIATKMDLVSNNRIEADITYTSIVETLDYISMLNKELKGNSQLTNRGEHRPYMIHNRTGEDCHIWIDASGSASAYDTGIDNTPVLVHSEEKRPWRFEDWRQRREAMETKANLLGIQFDNGKWEWVRRVQVDLEGVQYYSLRPDIDGVRHYMAVDVSLNPETRVKQVELRSPLLIINKTKTSINIAMCDSNKKVVSQVYHIKAGERFPIPLAYCYHYSILVQPGRDYDHGWSTRSLSWKDVDRGSGSGMLRCNKRANPGQPGERNKMPFYLHYTAVKKVDKYTKRKYPFMSISLTAPMEIENLLPYRANFQIVNQVTREVWNDSVNSGDSSPVYCFKPGDLMVLRMVIHEAGFSKCEGAIIESNTDEFPVESHITLLDSFSRKLELNLIRTDMEQNANGACFKISVYSPYVMINKTGLDMAFSRKGFFSGQTAIAGQNSIVNQPLDPMEASLRNSERQTPMAFDSHVARDEKLVKPVMFSYGSMDLRNRALVKINDSKWSEPLSFEALGSTFEIDVMARNSKERIFLGVEVEPGQGRYCHTKVVTFTPRFIVKNNTKLNINVRQANHSQSKLLKSGNRLPLEFMEWGKMKQLSLSMSGGHTNHPWTAPFDIDKLGQLHLKLPEYIDDDSSPISGGLAEKTNLLRIEVVLQGACLFVLISSEEKYWPFRVDNFTGKGMIFSQKTSRSAQMADNTRAMQSIGSFSHISSSSSMQSQANDCSSMYIKKYKLGSGQSMEYAWDFPASNSKELVVSIEGRQFHVNLNEIGRRDPFCYSTKGPNQYANMVNVEVVAEGPQHVLRLTKYNHPSSRHRVLSHRTETFNSSISVQSASSSSVFSLSSNMASAQPTLQVQSTLGGRTKSEIVNTTPQFMFNLNLTEGIGISLLNRHARELLYISLWGISFKFLESNEDQDIHLILKWLQIDNQTYGAQFPILLYPTDLGSGPSAFKNEKNDKNDMKLRPLFQIMMTRKKDESYGVEYLKYFTILLQEISIELDMNILLDILDFTQLDVPGWREHKEQLYNDGPIPEPREVDEGKRFYFGVLHLHPLRANISFMRSHPQDMDGSDAAGTNPSSSFDIIAYVTNVLTMAIGNVNDAPIALNALAIENVCVSIPVLLERIQTHYTHEFLSQIYKVVGSADLLGNPVGLFNTISSGVTDVFYEPYQGFTSNDPSRGVGVGLAKGAGSLFKKTVFGVSDSMYRLTGSVSKGLSAATMDRTFHNKRQLARHRHRPKHALYGVAWGAESFAKSIASGITGIVQRPIEGAEKEGVGGFIKGVGKGVIGFITKPAVGIFEMASNVSEGIRNTTTVFEEHDLDRMRLPRFVRRDRILEPYSAREAQGQAWMRELADGKFAYDDYAAHLELSKSDMVVLLTYSHIILFRHKKKGSSRASPSSGTTSASSTALSASNASIEFVSEILNLHTIQLEENGMIINLKKTPGEESNPCWFIPINDPQSRRWFYNRLDDVVKAFIRDHINS